MLYGVINLYRDIFLVFSKPEIVERGPLEGIDIRNPRNHLPLPQIWLGPGVNSLIFQRPEIVNTANFIYDIGARCRHFVISLSIELIWGFPVDVKLWKKAAAFNLTKAKDFQLRIEGAK